MTVKSVIGLHGRENQWMCNIELTVETRPWAVVKKHEYSRCVSESEHMSVALGLSTEQSQANLMHYILF
jgi:hypothetical protein